MAIYEQCSKCNKFIFEGEKSESNYFSGIGLVCPECSKILLRKKEKEILKGGKNEKKK